MLDASTFAGNVNRAIYLDYQATTPTDPRVAEVVLKYLTNAFGNASSSDHTYGDDAEKAVATSREQVASLLGCTAQSVVFTSGATESINLAILGFARAVRQRSPIAPFRVAAAQVEHRAVIDSCRLLADEGDAHLSWLSVDHLGRVDLADVEDACRRGLDLLCVMAANNEVGTLYPIQAIASIASQYGVALLTDATQMVGRQPIQFTDWGLTFLAFSAHKIHGPKGVGALIISPGTSIKPIIYGGGHQRGLRSGTLNVPGIAGLGEACRLRSIEMLADEPQIARRRDVLQALLLAAIPDLVVNGDVTNRLAGNLHVSVPDVPNGAVIARIRHRLAVSTGAACSSGIEAPSHVLRAMGLPEPLLGGALRISLGKFTSDDELTTAAELIGTAVSEARRAVRNAT